MANGMPIIHAFTHMAGRAVERECSDVIDATPPERVSLQSIIPSSGSVSCLQQFARDDCALDLVRALVDLRDLCIAVESLHSKPRI